MNQTLKRTMKITASVLWVVALLLLALLLVSVLGAKFRGEVPKVFGYSVLHIISGSMEPEIPKGTYILIRETAPEKVKKRDIISFYSSDPTIYGLPNTHRVEDITFEDGKRVFLTKGDANYGPDRYGASEDRLIGVYVANLTALTFLSDAMKGNGVYIAIIALQLAMIGMIAFSVFRKKRKSKESQENQE